MSDQLARVGVPAADQSGEAVDAAVMANANALRQAIAGGTQEQAAIGALARRFMTAPGVGPMKLVVGLARMLAHAIARINWQADRIEQLRARIADLELLASTRQDGDR
jgi:hypothetical protein